MKEEDDSNIGKTDADQNVLEKNNWVVFIFL